MQLASQGLSCNRYDNQSHARKSICCIHSEGQLRAIGTSERERLVEAIANLDEKRALRIAEEILAVRADPQNSWSCAIRYMRRCPQ